MDYPAGWYVDPRDPTIYRYFDGSGWTHHTSPSSGELPNRPPIGWQRFEGGARREWNYGAPSTQIWPPMSAPTWSGPSAQRGETTPDGIRLASWGRRLAARVLDGVFAFLLGLPVTGYFIVRYVEALLDWQRRLLDQATTPGNSSISFTAPDAVLKWLLPIALLQLAVAVGYEAFFLHRRGATPGKSILGLRVRLRQRPGRLPAAAIGRRILVMFGLQLLSLLPVLGVFVGIAVLLNYLWPLWDPAKQAWHDKAAATNVVAADEPAHHFSTAAR